MSLMDLTLECGAFCTGHSGYQLVVGVEARERVYCSSPGWVAEVEPPGPWETRWRVGVTQELGEPRKASSWGLTGSNLLFAKIPLVSCGVQGWRTHLDGGGWTRPWCGARREEEGPGEMEGVMLAIDRTWVMGGGSQGDSRVCSEGSSRPTCLRELPSDGQ